MIKPTSMDKTYYACVGTYSATFMVPELSYARYDLAAQVSYLDVQVVDWTGNIHLQGSKASASAKLESFLHPPIQFSGEIVKKKIPTS